MAKDATNAIHPILLNAEINVDVENRTIAHKEIARPIKVGFGGSYNKKEWASFTIELVSHFIKI